LLTKFQANQTKGDELGGTTCNVNEEVINALRAKKFDDQEGSQNLSS